MAGGARWQQDTQNMFSAFNTLANVMRQEQDKKKKDAIAREIAARMYPEEDIDSHAELEMKMKVDEAMANQNYRQVMTQKALQPPANMVGEDGLTPYQRMQLDLSRQREDRIAGQAGSKSADSMEKLNQDLRTAFGIEAADIDSVIKNGAEVDASGKVTFTTRQGVPMETTKDKLLPFVNRGLALYKGAGTQGGAQPAEPAADAIAQQPKPAVAPKTTTLTIPPDKAAEADAIRAAFKAGQITREEAKAKLAALAAR